MLGLSIEQNDEKNPGFLDLNNDNAHGQICGLKGFIKRLLIIKNVTEK